MKLVEANLGSERSEGTVIYGTARSITPLT
jgi:hypothetical protein